MRPFIGCLVGWLMLSTLQAQNLDQFDWKKGITVNGSINANVVGYHHWGGTQRRDPFNYFLTGNLSIGLFGYSAPFSFSYSNQQTSFAQPFNQIKFAPQYKWVKTYIGNTSMNFSNYTLAGHMFSGVGVDLSPKRWRVSLMYGRLKKAVEYSLTDTLQHSQASYKRMGYGFKVGYEGEKQQAGVIFFYAKDDPTSLPFVLPTQQLTPQENTAIGLTFKRTFKRVSVEGEYSLSILNTNRLAEPTQAQHSLLGFLMPQNSTTRYFDALSSAVSYQANAWGLALRYERVAPEYQTLGAYYFNNDMENWTVQPSLKLWKGKVSLSGQTGLQRNNLDASRTSTTKRWVTSFNLALTPKESWNISANYSNFTSYTRLRPQADPFFQNALDSLNFYQVNHTGGTTTTYMFGSKQRKQSLMLTLGYQQASNQASNTVSQAPSQFLNGNLAYTLNFAEKQWSLTAGINGFHNTMQGLKNLFVGPSLNMGKGLWKKTVRLSLTSSYSYATTNGENAGDVLNNRLALQYTPPKGKQDKRKTTRNVSFNLNHVQRFGAKGYSEATATLNMGWGF